MISDVFAQENFNDLIRQVQINNQQFYDNINSVTFSGHTKTYIYVSYPIFDTQVIQEYEEYYFEGFWQKPDSLRLIITAFRNAGVSPDYGGDNIYIKVDSAYRGIKTKKNSDGDSAWVSIKQGVPLLNPFHFTYETDSDSTQINEAKKVFQWPVFPFVLGADSIYDYEIISTVGFGSVDANMRRIAEVFVSPKDPNFPAVTGTFQIDADKKVVVGSDFVFNDATDYLHHSLTNHPDFEIIKYFDVDAETVINTKKALFYSEYWLPQFIEEEFFSEVFGFHYKIHRIIEYDNYIINPEQSQLEKFVNKKLIFTADSTKEKELFENLSNPATLTEKEEREIIDKVENDIVLQDLLGSLFDSESTVKDAVRKGFKDRTPGYLQLAHQLMNNFRYNRVEGFRADLMRNIVIPGLKNSVLSLRSGYGFHDSRWKAESALIYYPEPRKKLFLEGNLYYTTGFEETKKTITTGRNSFSSLIIKDDFRDYYYKTGGSVGVGYKAGGNLALKLSYVSQKEENAVTNTKFSIFRSKESFRYNPEILEGRFQGLKANLLYRTNNLIFDLFAEYTDRKLLGSDFTYSLLKSDFSYNYHINRKNNFSFNLTAGISSGNLIPQRRFDFGGKTFADYSGNLRGVEYKYFTGDRMVYSTLEFNHFFGTMSEYDNTKPWFKNLKKILKFSIWSGVGWSELSEKNRILYAGFNTPVRVTDGIYSEYGIGIADILNLLRVDFIVNNVGNNKVIVGLNFMR